MNTKQLLKETERRREVRGREDWEKTMKREKKEIWENGKRSLRGRSRKFIIKYCLLGWNIFALVCVNKRLFSFSSGCPRPREKGEARENIFLLNETDSIHCLPLRKTFNQLIYICMFTIATTSTDSIIITSSGNSHYLNFNVWV